MAGSEDAVHQRRVAYVHALSAAPRPRAPVWLDHAYARPNDAPAARDAPHVRVLLAEPPPPADPDHIDVEALDTTPGPPDSPRPPPADEDDTDPAPDDGDDWEARVEALAPTAAHARLAHAAFDLLRRFRLARLVGSRGPRRDDARATARRLRLALAGHWAAPGAPQQRPPAWLHAALHAYLPCELRLLYEEVLDEMQRATPKLAERMLAGRAPAPPPSPGGAAVAEDDAAKGPLLVWLRTGRDRLEERWEQRLRPLLPTRPLDVAASAGTAAPEVWCAAVAGAARTALADVVATVGDRDVIVGGVGGGAAVCAAALGGVGCTGVRGALLLAPALLTAEGPRDAPDDPLSEVRVPMLLVVGSAAADAWRGASRSLAARRRRRLVEVRGADRLLRLPYALRRRLALSQRTLDAAIAEECARWAAEVVEGDVRDDESHIGRSEEPAAHPAPAADTPQSAGVFVLAGGDSAQPCESEEYAHLPAAVPPHTRAIEIVEGRVVSRVTGGTPLTLLPPRRAATPPAPARSPASLAAADILQLPIVFADDERPGAGVKRSGTEPGRRVKYARVIVAKRGRPRERLA